MKSLLYLLIGSILLGCSKHYINDDHIAGIRSEKIKAEHLADLSDRGIRNVQGFIKHGKRLIVNTVTTNGFMQSLDINAWEQKISMAENIYSVKKLRQLSSFYSFDGSCVTALDFRTGELIESHVSPLSRNTGKETVYQLPQDKQHLVAVKAGDIILSTGFYEEGRYQLYSLTEKQVRYFLSYPNDQHHPNLQELTKAILYASSILRIRPDQTAFVCADMYSGLIDFCRITPDGIERIKLEQLSSPHVKIIEEPLPRVAYYRDNRFGFMDIAVTQDHIYALYSGKSYRAEQNRAFECNQLLEYDWNGNLLRTLDVSTTLTKITYDREEKKLYGMACNSDISLIKIEI